MTRLLILLALALPALAQVRLPAEWEPQSAVWTAWPTYQNVAGRPSEDVVAAIVGALAGRVPVLIAVQDAAEARRVRAELARRGVPAAHVRCVAVPHADMWMRDTGGLFTTGPRPAVVDLRFNGWGYGPRSLSALTSARQDERVDRAVAAAHGLPVRRSALIGEGGALETDGAGTLLTTSSVMFQRNPTWNRGLVEAELSRLFGARRTIWLEQGVTEDDLTFCGPLPDGTYSMLTTGGHVDEFARFASPDTILLAEVPPEDAARDPVARETARRMTRNAELMAAARTADGRPYRVIRVPTPEPVQVTIQDGDGVFDFLTGVRFDGPRANVVPGRPIRATAAASYLNYLVSNGVVLAQKYDRPRDALALAALARAFPGRRVVAIDARNVNLGGGGVHCITQQVPAGITLPAGLD